MEASLESVLRSTASRHEAQIKLIAQIIATEYGYTHKYSSYAGSDCGGDFEGNCIDSDGKILEVGDEPSPENCSSFFNCKKAWKIYKLLDQLPSSWFGVNT